MGTREGQDRRALEEAAAWFSRLKQPNVNEATVDEFFDWRRAPANDAAYTEVETRWRQADRVRNDPELVALTEAALRRETLWMKVRRFVRRPIAPLSVAALAALGGFFMLFAEFRPESYRTEVGAQQIVRLDDGSILRLNTDSKVEVRFGRDERRVRLVRGEGYFEVAHDAARPFIVDAGGVQVRALGTKFDVRRAETATRVTLVEGRVRVSRTSRPETWTLNPNQQITVNGDATGPRPADVAAVTSWTTGRLRFQETPLATAIAEMNRYSRNKIVLDAADLEAIRVSGVFEAGNTPAFVSAVTEIFDLEAETTSSGVTLRARASRPAA